MPLFLISLAIGLFIVYITIPASKIIYVYPTPDNINQLQFKDYSNNCFTFEAEKVEEVRLNQSEINYLYVMANK